MRLFFIHHSTSCTWTKYFFIHDRVCKIKRCNHQVTIISYKKAPHGWMRCCFIHHAMSCRWLKYCFHTYRVFSWLQFIGAFTFCKAFVVCVAELWGFRGATRAREARVSRTARMAYIQSGMFLHRLTSPLLRLCSYIFFFPSLGTSLVEIFCCSEDSSVSSENSNGVHSIRCSVASSHMSLSQSIPSGA